MMVHSLPWLRTSEQSFTPTAMTSEQSPILFSVRSAREGQAASTQGKADPQTVACQLLHTLTATLNTPHTLPQLTEVLGIQLRAGACVLLWHHQSTDTLTHTVWHPQTSPQICQLLPSSRSAQSALQRQVALALIQQFTEPAALPPDLHWRKGLTELLREDQQDPVWLAAMRSLQIIPLHTAPDCRGVVILLNRRRQPVPTLDEALAINVASVVGIALHQHHLQIQSQQCAEQLRYLNYLKEDFLSTLNHELRTPLTSMMLAIRMLRRPDLTPERTAMYLDILEQQCGRETSLVNDLLMLQTVDTGNARTQLIPVDLVQVLTTLAEDANESLESAQLSLLLNVPAEPVRIMASASHLTRALQELLTNARKYSAPGSTLTLTLAQPVATDSQATLQISNVGAGIQADEIPHIFEKFRRGKNATKDAIPGTGTGLALVRGLLEQLEATIAVTSHPLGEQLWQTCFSLSFRLHQAPSA